MTLGMMATKTPSHGPPQSEQALTVRAPAKLNLTLRVLGRREDGYHELESLIVAVDLYDELTVERRSGAAWRLLCEHPGVPADQDNLVLRAARELARDAAPQRASGGDIGGLDITLTKRIPPGAGLGGGSSDAAAALVAINELYRLGLSGPELAACAGRIGSDVPFFLHQPAAVVRGRGEQVETVSALWPGYFLLICPPLNCATRRVYARWKPNSNQTDRPIHPLAGSARLTAAQLAERLFNDLEAPAFSAYPQLAQWHRQVQEVCPHPVRLTGSGSGLFCPLDTREAGENLAATIEHRLGFTTFSAQLLPDGNTRGAAT